MRDEINWRLDDEWWRLVRTRSARGNATHSILYASSQHLVFLTSYLPGFLFSLSPSRCPRFPRHCLPIMLFGTDHGHPCWCCWCWFPRRRRIPFILFYFVTRTRSHEHEKFFVTSKSGKHATLKSLVAALVTSAFHTSASHLLGWWYRTSRRLKNNDCFRRRRPR